MTSLTRPLFRIACLALAAVAQPAMAQGPASAALRSLPSDVVVRLSAAGKRSEGRLGQTSDDSVTLMLRQGVSSVALASVDTIWRKRRHVGRGALIGGVVGAGLFTGFLHLIVTAFCDADASACRKDHNRAWAAGIVLGGSGGALLGAGVGSLFPRWVRILP